MLISDELLRHLMAVGQVDVLVGVPTLNNAATIRGVVEAVHEAFGRYFPRDRTLLFNSDGGSTDGTPALVQDGGTGDSVTVSHALRTVHRISAPYHGATGKTAALRQIMAAADLTQARAVAIVDADITSLTPEWIAALVQPVMAQQFDYVAPSYARHPLEGPLVTQLVRPLVRAAYGWHVREPMAPDFGCSHRFVAHCMEEDFWSADLAPAAIDVVITTTALAGDFRCCQAPLGLRALPPGQVRPALHEVFQQVVGMIFSCLDRHAGVWATRTQSEALPTVAPAVPVSVEAPRVDGRRLTQSFCADLRNLQSVLQPILTEPTRTALTSLSETDCDQLQYTDELWVSTVYEFLLAHHHGVMRREHIAQALMPLYLGRAGSFLIQHASSETDKAEAALESLSQEFERRKPDLVERWNQTNPR